MRHNKFVPLLAGTLLAAMLAAPTCVFAAPDRNEAVSPLPPAQASDSPIVDTLREIVTGKQ